jgi:CRP/FNR family transcriptional regulator
MANCLSSEPESGRVAPSDFLGRLQPADYAALLAIAHAHRFRRGEFVFRADSPGENVYLLRRGKVKIHHLSADGREVILWFCFPGEVFGLAEVAQGGGRAVDAQACADSEVLAVPRPQFCAYLEAHPKAAILSMQVLGSRLRVLGDMMVNLVSDDVETRIAKLVLRLGARYGVRGAGEIRLTVPLTHQEIADMVGTTRQTATSVIGALRRQGVLRIDNHLIRIESEELLSGITRAPTRGGKRD